MPVEDKQLGLKIHRTLAKRQSIDLNDIRVYTSGGTVYLGGRLKAVRGVVNFDLKHEMEIIERMLRTIPGVRDIVNELRVD